MLPAAGSPPPPPPPDAVGDGDGDNDRNGDGEISRTEFVKCINEDQDLARELHDLLGLPEHIRQEDGTRDAFVRAFADMDDDSSGCIDLKEFIAYLRKVQVPQAS